MRVEGSKKTLICVRPAKRVALLHGAPRERDIRLCGIEQRLDVEGLEAAQCQEVADGVGAPIRHRSPIGQDREPDEERHGDEGEEGLHRHDPRHEGRVPAQLLGEDVCRRRRRHAGGDEDDGHLRGAKVERKAGQVGEPGQDDELEDAADRDASIDPGQV